jgi:hypothetical protein
MNQEERYKILRQLMWDYTIDPSEADDVLTGRKEKAGHYNRQDIFLKLLESYSWFTILQLFSAYELKHLITDDIIARLRSKSLKAKYEFVQKRLQELVPVAG